ncbi:sulfurtransferase [Gordonia sp. NPDC058843]|uniref:sulfurtransferase n=1 Tax=Gordonia sp. NPDC058843 TaxID=3346648 RepID=UPI00368609AF
MSTPVLPALVDVTWLRERLDDPSVVIVDATTHLPIPKEGPYVPESGAESYRAEHIPGAVFADLLTDFADAASPEPWTVPSSEQFASAASALGIGDGATVVVYDQLEGFWATRLWWHLRLEGFDAVTVLDGGLPAWKAAGAPVTDAESTVTPRAFSATRRPELLRSTVDVAAALDDPSTLLVNVLDEATYRGETTTYARQGHIPGSVNLPVFSIRDAETGDLRPIDELRREFEAAGLLAADAKVVTYCGGGIAATGIAHALALVGRDDVAVYDGSMTAWANDPSLPLVTGSEPR